MIHPKKSGFVYGTLEEVTGVDINSLVLFFDTISFNKIWLVGLSC